MTDNYEYEKSTRPQDIDDYSPYMDKQYNGFINDLNSSVYTNTSLSLVQFDLGQIYNSQKFTDTNDMFMVIPITMVAAYSSNSAVYGTPAQGNVNLLSLKTNFINLIHQADLQINGKTIESTQPFINIQKNFQMLSEMGVSDLANIGPTIGFGDVIDNHRSVIWNSNLNSANGNGFTNNKVFIPNGQTYSGHRFQTTSQKLQNSGCINDALTSKLSRYVDTSSTTSYNGIYNNILTSNQLHNECKPTYEVNGAYMIWYDYACIRMSSIFESLANIGLVRKFDSTLRLWINTGTVAINVSNPNSTNLGYVLNSSNNSFTNSVPFTINYLNDTAANGGIIANAQNIVAGCYIAKPPGTSYYGVNLSLSGASHPLPACRIYFSQIQVEPQKALTYVQENQSKKVIYRTLLTNQYNNTSAGGTFNNLINSGVTHPVGVLVVPYISSSQSSGFGDYQWKNPFDSCPSTSAPISLINFQVSVGGVNQLQSTLNYTYENFIEQVNLAEALTSSDLGISCGLFSQQYWETFRYYYVNVERSAITDKNVARNINISFQNNSSVAIDILVFIVYSDSFTINVETGIITK